MVIEITEPGNLSAQLINDDVPTASKTFFKAFINSRDRIAVVNGIPVGFGFWSVYANDPFCA